VEICFRFVVCCTVLFFSGFLTSCVDSKIGHEGAVAIAEALKLNKCLEKLNLHCECCVNR